MMPSMILSTLYVLQAAAAPLAASDTLVHIRNLAPRNLRSAYFTTDSTQNVHITAVGAAPVGRGAVRRFLDNGVFQSREKTSWDHETWPANAWILDARSRRVVWELRNVQAQGNDGLREFSGVVRLPAGTYEVKYAALFPVSREWDDESDWRVRSDRSERTDTQGLHGPYLDDGAYRRFQLIVRGSGKRITEAAATTEAQRLTLFTLQGSRPNTRDRIGFELDRPLPVEVYVVGEGEDRWIDYGWIMEATTRRVVWSAQGARAVPGGGARKNRTVRASLELPAGRYVAVYSTDEAHQLGAWNATPPFDPASWGLSIRLKEEGDRGAARTFAYEPIATADAFVRLTRLGDDELRWQRFIVSRALDVRIFALGEGRDEMNDVSWIVDSAGRSAWRMTYELTEPAGGSSKNRVFSGTVHLKRGQYTAYATTDGTHSFGDGWNSDEPLDGEFWGLTIAPLDPRKDAGAIVTVNEAAPTRDPSILAQITRVREEREEEQRFTLATAATVRIYALGEGIEEMSDYAWIDDESGREIWRMRQGETEHAGGAEKNRRIQQSITLPAGSYRVHYRTDGSHSWKDWNSPPPDDPLNYGVTVYRSK